MPQTQYSAEVVLVLDDDDQVREPLVEMLQSMGFQTYGVGTPSQALEELRREDYTFLVTDMKMPGMDGLELIELVNSELPQVSIIAVTGYYKEYTYTDVIKCGAVDFINKPFDAEELEAKISRAINERNTRQELNRLAVTDPLTELYNQRQLYKRLGEEIVRAERQKHDFSLLLLDLDDFKNYNDAYGHLAGDELLKKVAKVIDSSIRQGVDSSYRYGGDEFAILLVEAGSGIAEEITQRIKEGLASECSLNASVAHANFMIGMSAEELIYKADQKLYEVKRNKGKH